MSKLILKKYNKNVQIIIIDWRDIVSNDRDGGLSPDISSTWINSVAETTVKALVNWRINPKNTTIIGHSLGTLLGEEISKKLGGTKAIMLDPPTSLFLNYKIDTEGNRFKSFSGDERCIVGARSFAGSESLAEDCREKYLINYYDTQNYSAAKEFIEDATINLIKQKSLKKIKSKINLKNINWKVATTVGVPTAIIASIYIDSKNITLADVELFIAKQSVSQIAKGGCTIASTGTGILAPVTKTACDAIIVTAVNTTLETIMASLDEHKWTVQTYNEIIKHPFYDNILSLNDQRNFSEIDGGVFNINHNGMIYTERKLPEKIKYLKTEQSETPNNYTLYGNSVNNEFECSESLWAFDESVWRECIMYGDRGNDNFNLSPDQLGVVSSNFMIDDFISKNDADKVYIKSFSEKMWGKTLMKAVMEDFNGQKLPAIEVSCVVCKNDDAYADMKKMIYFNSNSYSDVKRWVDMINEPEEHEIQDRLNNPIKLR